MPSIALVIKNQNPLLMRLPNPPGQGFKQHLRNPNSESMYTLLLRAGARLRGVFVA